MISLYNELKSTTSTNDKVDILQKHGASSAIREAIRLCHEPFIHSYMNKVPAPKMIGTLNFESSFPMFMKLFDDLNNRRVTGNAAKEAVLNFLESVDPDAQQMYTLIIKKDLKAGIGCKLVNKAFGDNFVNIFEVQLGEPYDPERTYRIDKKTEVKEWWASPKLDGIRGFQEGDDCLRTRNGNKIFGFDHILEEIKDLKKRFGLHIVDGELYKMGMPFQTITSYVNGDKKVKPEHKQEIRFHVFAVCKEQDWNSTEEMVELMRSIPWNEYTYLVQVPYEKIANEADIIYEKMNAYFELGYEGIMLRHPTRTWSKGRSHDIVKVKPTYSEDFRIVGFEYGKPGTQFDNTLGALLLEGTFKISKKIKGKDTDTVYPIRSNCGGGFKIKPELGITRDQILNDWDNWMGTMVEVEFQGVTDKPREDGTYALRFPRFKRRRDDKPL